MTRAFALLVALIASLALAAPAAAQHSISKVGGVVTINMHSDGGTITVSECDFSSFIIDCENYEVSSYEGFTSDPAGCTDVENNNRRYNCSPLPTRTVINGSAAKDTVSPSCLAGPVIVFNAGSGDDSISGGCPVDATMGAGHDTASGSGTMRGGAGRDTLVGGSGADILDGGDDSDRLEGGAGTDELRGGSGRDVLLPGAGTDAVIEGGEGVDTVSYENLTSDQGLSISINGAADDGAPGENDNVAGDVENIVGSPSPDSVTGSDGVNVIDTDSGNDNIDPRKGHDFVSSGGGDDVISARDGFIDAIDCGDGNDKVVSDEFDNVSNCETNDKSRELMSDVDNDGVAAPTDCDDRNPARRPGLPDKPGNKIDEDCSGKDAPFFRIVTGVQSLFRAGSTTTISRLNLVDVPAGATVEVRCKRGKKSCMKTKRTRTPKGAAQLNLRRKLKLARIKLRPGSVLEVRITNTDSIGKVVQYPIKRRRIPVSRLRCLPPRAKSPRRC